MALSGLSGTTKMSLAKLKSFSHFIESFGSFNAPSIVSARVSTTKTRELLGMLSSMWYPCKNRDEEIMVSLEDLPKVVT